MNNELTVQEAALAWAQGKNVEAMQASSKWGLIIKPGCSSGQGVYYPNIFIKENCGDCSFRLAPEPPAKRYRPWTPEEVPVGALIRHKDWMAGDRLMICGVWGAIPRVLWCYNEGISDKPAEWVLNSGWEHSTDNGKTWLPCGVEVES